MKRIQRMFALALIVTAAGLCGSTFAEAENKMDSRPGPAYTMVDGKVSHIEGNLYTVQSESANYQNMGSTTNVNEVRIVVSNETKKIRGEKKVGDKIRAEVTQGGFANSIQ